MIASLVDLYKWPNGKFFKEYPLTAFPNCAAVDAELNAHPEKRGDTTGCGDNFAGGALTSVVKQLAAGKKAGELEVVFGTPFITLYGAAEIVKNEPQVHIAAQNCYNKEKGAYTGETSVDMIKAIGVEYVILGHSERREYFNEGAEMLAKKVDLTLKKGLMPIFWCGEKLEIREKNQHFELVKNQITDSLFHLDAGAMKNIVIAYEPVWAIGTGVTASPEQAQEMHAFIRNLLAEKYGTELADEIK